MKYEALTTEQQKELLSSRLLQYEREHYNHQINHDLLVASAETDEATQKAIEATQKSMVLLDELHARVNSRLKEIKIHPATPSTP